MKKEQSRHEDGGPVSRRRHALRRLRAPAGGYRTRYLAAAAPALILSVALILSAAGAFEPFANESPTLGVGRAGIMADFTRQARADSSSADSSSADSLRSAEAAPVPRAEADNTGVVEEVKEIVGEGEASYYGDELAGNPTASGETFDPNKLTAAHRTLPLGSRVRVTNLRNDESVVVRINDRGPYHGRRILDLSRRAARRIGMLARGKARVKVELLEE